MGWVTALLGSTPQGPQNAPGAPGGGPRGLPFGTFTQDQAPQPSIVPGALGHAGTAALGGSIPSADISILPPTGTQALQQEVLAQQSAARAQQTDPNSIASLLGSLAMGTMGRPGSAPGAMGAGPRGVPGRAPQLELDPTTGQFRWVTV